MSELWLPVVLGSRVWREGRAWHRREAHGTRIESPVAGAGGRAIGARGGSHTAIGYATAPANSESILDPHDRRVRGSDDRDFVSCGCSRVFGWLDLRVYRPLGRVFSSRWRQSPAWYASAAVQLVCGLVFPPVALKSDGKAERAEARRVRNGKAWAHPRGARLGHLLPRPRGGPHTERVAVR